MIQKFRDLCDGDLLTDMLRLVRPANAVGRGQHELRVDEAGAAVRTERNQEPNPRPTNNS